MKKVLDKWWIFVCWGISIFLVWLFIVNDPGVALDSTVNPKAYMKKLGNNVHPLIDNIKIYADGNEYEVVIIDGDFRNRRYDNYPFNLKTALYQGRADLNYYILKEGGIPLDEDYNLWCFSTIIPVKRDSVLSDYHIDGKAINETIDHFIYCNFIWHFMDEYLEDGNKDRYTGWSCNNFEMEDYKKEDTIVFTESEEVEAEGELLITYTVIVNEEKVKVIARLVIESLKEDIDLYITTEIM
ncbi:hypothetical protein [Oceanirhabdus seepicola]|uniref:Uncharacterized protein n=1 Tax=Oceanirhabdus seepicola TaxID=2828781 RepID=A0A9J6NYU8_9CLOT|nr:hypothetical protein [Oceanirhabdus seepicola]MCM1989150.1 hypothetical protein [Oceanirhabdus seepicola]